jgi:hypothetical protein
MRTEIEELWNAMSLSAFHQQAQDAAQGLHCLWLCWQAARGKLLLPMLLFAGLPGAPEARWPDGLQRGL